MTATNTTPRKERPRQRVEVHHPGPIDRKLPCVGSELPSGAARFPDCRVLHGGRQDHRVTVLGQGGLDRSEHRQVG